MTIAQIKEQLPILSVLSHYSLRPNSNAMLACPFHDDQKPSMKVYLETNTVYCFAGHCRISNLDAIDFIMQMESINKHEAIVKAKSLLGEAVPIQPSNSTKPTSFDAEAAFRRYVKSLHHHKKAQEYCKNRCLNWRELAIGYKSRKTKDKWGRGCVIFPLKDSQGRIVSLYGRSIFNQNHYYQSQRRGLYPAHPPTDTKRLILTESIIDAASLLQLFHPDRSVGEEVVAGEHSILALYGTNGLTAEHLSAIQSLKELEEITFFLDADQAGQEAVSVYAAKLHELLPNVRLMNILGLDEEDVNGILQAHGGVILTNMVARRLPFKINHYTSTKVKATEERKAEPVLKSSLDSTNPHNLIYATKRANYYIKGGVRYGAKDFDSLKVTLVVENGGGKKSRNKVDLYEDKQVEKISRQVAEKLQLRADLVELDLQALTDELEAYRQKLYESDEEPVRPINIAPDLRQSCLHFLQQPDLMKAIDEKLQAYGLIGEQNNRRLGFCIVSSYGMPQPLHGLIQGSSGSGKTHLLSKLCGLVPPQYYLPITRATDNSFYNYQPYELKNKLISVEDKDAMSEEANLAFRELQTKGMVSSSTTGQDEQGHSRSYVKQVYGPIASLACTTKGELYLDDMNRCFLMAVDESAQQTRRILDYQKQLAAGLVDPSAKSRIEAFMRSCLRLLRPYEVVIPYAPRVHLPDDVKDKRRLNGLYLSLVKQVTLLNQYRRKQDDRGRLISTPRDLQTANEIMFDAIVLKADELHGSLRAFYEQLKTYIRQVAGGNAEKYAFRQREVRQALRCSKTYIKQHLRSLIELEYIQIVSGSEYRGYYYQICYWDDNEALRKRIRQYLDDQIRSLTGEGVGISGH